MGRETVLAHARAFGLELRVPVRDAVGAGIYLRGMHAPEVADFLVRRLELEPGELVFDVGASIGWYALLLSRLAPRGVEIHAFEPDPWARGLLQQNLSHNRADDVVVVDAAIGDTAGEATLHRYGGRRRTPLGSPRADRLPVRMLRLDDYCAAQGLAQRPVGLVKLGVQGFEFQALQGARATLARCRTVLTEYAPLHLRQADVHPAGVLDLLVELGFSPAVIELEALRPVDRAELLADARPQTLAWTRPVAARRPATPDPHALAI
jgi:FkbM family methyltransferase